jgi:hypothetical protein
MNGQAGRRGQPHAGAIQKTESNPHFSSVGSSHADVAGMKPYAEYGTFTVWLDGIFSST